MRFPNRRQLLYATLYFCEGAPIGLLWWALPAYWSARDVPLAQVTTITAVTVLPWTFKWLWAPLVDFTAPRWSYRRWIVVAQLVMGALLVPLVWLEPQTTFAALVACLVAHATAAATQDVAIDGMCVATVAEHERGEINGWMQVGMLAGRALFGGGALLLAAHVGLTAAVVALVVMLWTVALTLALWPQAVGAAIQPEAPADDASGSEGISEQPPPGETGSRFAFLADRRVWLGLLFALVGGTAYESVGALLGAYLGSSELSLPQVGLFQLGPLAAAMATGALVGGAIADRFGHVRVAWFSLLALVVLNLLLASAAGGAAPALVLIVAEYAMIGVFTASSYALFMDIASSGLKATLFSALAGATNACEAVSALVAGRLASTFSFSTAFTIMTVPSLLGLAILPLLRKKHKN